MFIYNRLSICKLTAKILKFNEFRNTLNQIIKIYDYLTLGYIKTGYP